MKFLSILFLLVVNLFSYQVLVDSTTSLTFDDVIASKDKFKEERSLFFGNTDAAVWIKHTLHNPSDEVHTYTLTLDHMTLSTVMFYDPKHLQAPHYKSGFLIPKAERNHDTRYNLFQTQMQPHETKEIYIRVTSSTAMGLHLNVFSNLTDFHNFMVVNDSLTIAMISILIAFLVYNAFIYIIKRDKTYLFYILYLFAYIIFQLQYTGYMHYIVDLTDTFQFVFNVSIVMFFVFIFLFMIEMLEVKSRFPKIHMAFKVIISFYLLVLMFSLIDNTFASAVRNFVAVPGGLMIVTIALVTAVIHKVRYAVYLLVGWMPYIFSMVYSAIYFSYGFEHNFFIRHGMLLGSVIEVIIFSVILALKMRHLRQEVSFRDGLLQLKSKEAQMGQILGMIAHQWKQPLTSISMGTLTQMTKNELGTLKQEELQKHFEGTIEQVQFLSETIDDFRSFFKIEKTPSTTTIEKPIHKALTILDHTLKMHNVRVELTIESKQTLDIYVNEITQVILNILKNADDNFLEKNIASPIIHINVIENAEYLLLNIYDNGGGIPEHLHDTIFDYAFSTKNAEEGTGLGLYMVRRIIEDHHQGKIDVHNMHDGACFTIKLPYQLRKNHQIEESQG